jgi:hypothetical protein
LKDLLNGVLCVEDTGICEYNGYTLQIDKGCLFPYKRNDKLPKKLEREEFIKTFGLKDSTQLEYNHKGKTAGKAKGMAVGKAVGMTKQLWGLYLPAIRHAE